MDNKHEELENQVIKGQINTHTTLSSMSNKINALEASIRGLQEALIENNLLPTSLLNDKIGEAKKEMMESGKAINAGITLRVDAPNASIPSINCLDRIHVCKAICCKLSFPLTASEVEGGKVKWELGKPYYIRQRSDGYCCSRGEEGKCGIYADRPKVCRTYTCEGDHRIWKDFDNMIINEEWINENLKLGFTE